MTRPNTERNERDPAARYGLEKRVSFGAGYLAGHRAANQRGTGQRGTGQYGSRPAPDGPLVARPSVDSAAPGQSDSAAPGQPVGSYGVAARGRGRVYHPAQPTRPSRLARFVAAYGWRAYAIPVLTVATLLCTADIVAGPNGIGLGGRSASSTATTASPAQINIMQPTGPPETEDAGSGGPMDALPAGGPYSTQGLGTFHVVPGTSTIDGTGPLHRYTVEVEDGINIDDETFAAEVESILGDPRGWGAGGRMSFQRVDDPTVASFRVTLASTMTVRHFCGYDVRTETSCYYGQAHQVVINDARWIRGALAFHGNLALYHEYVVTHEVGHSLGHHHQLCAAPGTPAPVMMQQTLSVGRCMPNPWPYPDGTHEVTGPPAPTNLPVGN